MPLLWSFLFKYDLAEYDVSGKLIKGNAFRCDDWTCQPMC